MINTPAYKTLHAMGAVVVLVAAGLVPGAVAQAKSVTYHYVGQPYTTVRGGTCLTTSMNVELKFVVPTALPANFLGQVTPTAWTASDGKTRFSSKSASAQGEFEIGTDGNGNISAWFVQVLGGPNSTKMSEVQTLNVQGSAGDLAEIVCRKTMSQGLSSVAGSW